jgi:ApbE superfamily uncharacterized protein (UPF0280 family)
VLAPTSAVLQDGRRHFQHGPIDIIAYAEGEAQAVRQAHDAAWKRFKNVLNELTSELVALRQPVGEHCALQGTIAQTMWQACHACTEEFITPMAAVAGAVAQALIDSYRLSGIDRAWVNNGGDIAVYLREGHSLKIGLFADLSCLNEEMLQAGISVNGFFEITPQSGVRGVATSGWRGRSHSLGLADSVTALAATAAIADAAATVIANAVNVQDPRIVRVPANSLKDDADLGDILVTVDVPELSQTQIHDAMQHGLTQALLLKNKGLIISAVITCQGWVTSTETAICSRMSDK